VKGTVSLEYASFYNLHGWLWAHEETEYARGTAMDHGVEFWAMWHIKERWAVEGMDRDHGIGMDMSLESWRRRRRRKMCSRCRSQLPRCVDLGRRWCWCRRLGVAVLERESRIAIISQALGSR
jgi:hypothetical protein